MKLNKELITKGLIIIAGSALCVTIASHAYATFASPVPLNHIINKQADEIENTAIQTTHEDEISVEQTVEQTAIQTTHEDEISVEQTVEQTVELEDIEEATPSESSEDEQNNIQYTFESLDKIMYPKCSLNIRNLPDTNGEKIGALKTNVAVHVIAKCNETGWYKIEYAQEDAYVSDSYLLNEPLIIEETTSDASNENHVENIVDGPFVGVNGADADMINYANQKWIEMVPANIREKLLNAGYKLYVDKGSVSARFGFDFSVCGVTDYTNKEIYMSHSKAQIKRALTHEAGHALDSIEGMPSFSAEWRDIYNAEKDLFHDYSSIGDGSETESPLEYFAAIFDNIVNNEEQTRTEVPLSYEFVKRYM